jgi:hypothetical protein
MVRTQVPRKRLSGNDLIERPTNRHATGISALNAKADDPACEHVHGEFVNPRTNARRGRPARLEFAMLALMMMHDQASCVADNDNKQGREHTHPVARAAGAVDRKATLSCDESCRIGII